VTLRQQIEDEIREHGPMPFSRYMEVCLYDPQRGYYSRHAGQFGKAGDFYTSSDIHAVFGRLLVRQFEAMWQALDRPPQVEILELGPGRGLFARDVLDCARRRSPDFFAAVRYTLQEASPALRAKLEETLEQHIASGKASLSVQPAAPAAPGSTLILETHLIRRTCPAGIPLIVFANEFLDALPVEILSDQGKLYLALEDNQLREVWLPCSPEELEFLDRYGVHPEPGERIEASLLAQHWMKCISGLVSRGYLLVVDYGYTRAEQLAGRHRGTLMAYRHHSASPNPYQAPGEQDITAHVNFTALAAAAKDAGMQVQPLITQSQFLMRIGEASQFADIFEDCRLPQERVKVALQLKHLVTPAGMGGTFHVFTASRGVEHKS